MNKEMMIGLIALLFVLVGYASLEFGLTSEVLPLAETIANCNDNSTVCNDVNAPDSGGDGLSATWKAITEAFKLFVNVLVSILQLLFFMAPGIPPVARVIIFVPIDMVLIYIIVRLARGGG